MDYVSIHVPPVHAQSCPTLCNPVDSTLPASFVHGILKARALEWAAISSSRGSSGLRDGTSVACIGRWILYQVSHKGSPGILDWAAFSFSSRSSQTEIESS